MLFQMSKQKLHIAWINSSKTGKDFDLNPELLDQKNT